MQRLSILLLTLFLSGCSQQEIQIEIDGIPRAPGGPFYQWTSFSAFERFFKEKKLDEKGRIRIANIPFGIEFSSRSFSEPELRTKAKEIMDYYIADIISGRSDDEIRPQKGMPYTIKP